MKKKDISEMSVFGLIEAFAEMADRISVIRDNNSDKDQEILGYLDEAKMYAGGAYTALNNYIQALIDSKKI